MPNLLDLAMQRMRLNGMTATEATACLEGFVNGEGRDLPWRNVTSGLTQRIADRIDKAAVNWCMAHRITDETVVEPVAAQIRDGKMLATGEVDA